MQIVPCARFRVLYLRGHAMSSCHDPSITQESAAARQLFRQEPGLNDGGLREIYTTHYVRGKGDSFFLLFTIDTNKTVPTCQRTCQGCVPKFDPCPPTILWLLAYNSPQPVAIKTIIDTTRRGVNGMKNSV